MNNPTSDPSYQAQLTNIDRRSFLKTGLGGALFLGTVSVTAGLSGCATEPAGRLSAVGTRMDASYQFRFLNEDDIALFEALLPAMIGPGLPEQPQPRNMAIAGTIERIDAGIHKFGSANQKELRRLFDLLNFGLTRVTVARVWSSWPNVTTAEADAFLERWRTSRIGLFNNGAHAPVTIKIDHAVAFRVVNVICKNSSTYFFSSFQS